MRNFIKRMAKHKFGIISSLIVAVLCFSAFIFSIDRAKRVPDAIAIRNENDFYKINENLSGYYVLADTIVFSKPVQPIGSPNHPFTGTFDGLGKYGLKNIVFDFAEIDLDKYTENGVTNIGLFSYNKGIIIHNEVTSISFLNANSLENRKYNIGVLTGKNEGKITSNTLYTPNGTSSFGSANEISVGCFSGYNIGDIRRNRIIGHLNIAISSTNKVCLGAFSGSGGGNSIYEMLQFNGNISIYNFDETEVNTIYCGCIVGSLNGGVIKNCDLQKASILNMKKNTEYSSCAGIVGAVDSCLSEVSISSCAVTGTIRSSSLIVNYVSSGIGKLETDSNASFSNVLIGGECTTYYIQADEEMITDICCSEIQNFNLNNCFVLDSYKIKTPCTKYIKNIVSLGDLTLNVMGWDDSYWSIENGMIHLKVFDL